MKTIDIIGSEQLKAITQLTRDLTELRQRNSAGLIIESYAPELFAKLILAYEYPEKFLSAVDQEIFEGQFKKDEQDARVS